ncbi:PadR family transcriptional regulator [Enterococcus sp. HY326]|uniref:PadR family transcriptional regulator n=1 Tax=Enterococcus sp. HY326 TaxID=2971265 RepID=UPI00223FA771|nr:PadR family transcriptional regulator [Enterococcus sp. HY326]
MDSQLKKGLLEYCILAFLNKNDSYGYQIVKEINPLLTISESTLYPILRRLEAAGKVEIYAKAHNGRQRKYYRITQEGQASVRKFLTADWPQLELIKEFIAEQNV